MSKDNQEKKIISKGIINKKKLAKSQNLRNYQRRVVKALKFLEDKKGEFSTIVDMPTGSGKTVTAVNYLYERAINRNKKVIWMAHRNLLLKQAVECFKDNGGLLVRDKIKYSIVSGMHGGFKVGIENSDIIFLSKDSAISYNHIDNIEAWLKVNKTDEIYFVIDEAHHAAAQGTQKFIKCLLVIMRDLGYQCHLIGLSATAYREQQDEMNSLREVFHDGVELDRENTYNISLDKDFGYRIKMVDIKALLAMHELENPQFIIKAVEAIIEGDTEREIEKYNRKVSEAVLPKVAEDIANNLDEYGKMIVFVSNIRDAFLLEEKLNHKGINTVKVITSAVDEVHREYYKKDKIESIIEQFEGGTSNVKILINVNILTEGVDIPDLETVYLVRPTYSLTLMKQMVGRVLRTADGKDKARVVYIKYKNHDKSAVDIKKLISPEDYDKDYPEIEQASLNAGGSGISKEGNQELVSKIILSNEIPKGYYIFEVPNEIGLLFFENIWVYDKNFGELETIKNNVLKLREKCDFTDYLDELHEEKLSIFDDLEQEDIPKEKILNYAKYIFKFGKEPDFKSFDDSILQDINEILNDLLLINNVIERETYLLRKYVEVPYKYWASTQEEFVEFILKSYQSKNMFTVDVEKIKAIETYNKVQFRFNKFEVAKRVDRNNKAQEIKNKNKKGLGFSEQIYDNIQCDHYRCEENNIFRLTLHDGKFYCSKHLREEL